MPRGEHNKSESHRDRDHDFRDRRERVEDTGSQELDEGIIQVQVIPQDDNWGETATSITETATSIVTLSEADLSDVGKERRRFSFNFGRHLKLFPGTGSVAPSAAAATTAVNSGEFGNLSKSSGEVGPLRHTSRVRARRTDGKSETMKIEEDGLLYYTIFLRESWMKERSEKDDLLKNIKLQHQQQQTRAQEAEVKLLELRRDVGLRFLERAYQESHITINNLIQAVNARVAGPKVEELINTWKSYAAECHQRVLQCKTTFNEQIELLKAGRNLSSVPQLPIPGPPPYPAIPVLQSVVPGQPQSQSQPQPQPQPLSQTQSQPPADSNSTSRPSEPSRPVVTAAGPAATTAATPSTSAAPSAVVPPTGSNASTNGEAPPGTGSVAPSAAAATTAAAAASTAAAAAAAADKGRPSNSYEKIMLRLSTMYPTFSRLELTGFIKEVRHNKHGSLTGLSLEDIVSSISELVEQKRKAGLLRPAPTAPVGRLNNNSPVPRPTVPPAGKPTQMQQPTQPGVKAAAAQAEGGKVAYGHYEEDPCVICHEDMNTSIDIVTLECTHRYHSPCVRKWLLGEQSTCPTCHVHALLPDEFPRLK